VNASCFGALALETPCQGQRFGSCRVQLQNQVLCAEQVRRPELSIEQLWDDIEVQDWAKEPISSAATIATIASASVAAATLAAAEAKAGDDGGQSSRRSSDSLSSILESFPRPDGVEGASPRQWDPPSPIAVAASAAAGGSAGGGAAVAASAVAAPTLVADEGPRPPPGLAREVGDDAQASVTSLTSASAELVRAIAAGELLPYCEEAVCVGGSRSQGGGEPEPCVPIRFSAEGIEVLCRVRGLNRLAPAPEVADVAGGPPVGGGDTLWAPLPLIWQALQAGGPDLHAYPQHAMTF